MKRVRNENGFHNVDYKKNNNTFLSDGWSGDWSVRVEVCSEVT